MATLKVKQPDGTWKAIPAIKAGGEICAPAIVDTMTGAICTTDIAAAIPLQGLILYGKTTQDGTPTPDAPVPLVHAGDGGGIGVNVCGKNLIRVTTNPVTNNGLTFTPNDDGSITVNGTAAANTMYYFSSRQISQTGNYILTGCPAGGSDTTYDLRAGASGNYRDFGNGVSFTLNAPTELGGNLCIMVRSGYTANNLVFKPMLRIASIADATFEPYKTGGSMTVNTPNGLPGIPVTSGGNYTDENGQQWICDEVDFERGVYVQRVCRADIKQWNEVKIPTDPAWYNADLSNSYEVVAPRVPLQAKVLGMCNVLPSYDFNIFYDKGIAEGVMNNQIFIVVNLDKSRGIDTIEKFKAWCNDVGFLTLKPLTTPVETALSAEELSAYAALHTHNPNATVYNDAGAGMAVDYVADTKRYIDKRIAAISAAILNN